VFFLFSFFILFSFFFLVHLSSLFFFLFSCCRRISSFSRPVSSCPWCLCFCCLLADFCLFALFLPDFFCTSCLFSRVASSLNSLAILLARAVASFSSTSCRRASFFACWGVNF